MNILLAAFPSNADKGRFIADTMPPLSLYTLAAVLREKYDNIIILDPNYFCGISIVDFEQCFLDFIANKNIGIIGFSSNTFNWALSQAEGFQVLGQLQMHCLPGVRTIKKRPGKPGRDKRKTKLVLSAVRRFELRSSNLRNKLCGYCQTHTLVGLSAARAAASIMCIAV